MYTALKRQRLKKIVSDVNSSETAVYGFLPLFQQFFQTCANNGGKIGSERDFQKIGPYKRHDAGGKGVSHRFFRASERVEPDEPCRAERIAHHRTDKRSDTRNDKNTQLFAAFSFLFPLFVRFRLFPRKRLFFFRRMQIGKFGDRSDHRRHRKKSDEESARRGKQIRRRAEITEHGHTHKPQKQIRRKHEHAVPAENRRRKHDG